MRAYSSLCTYAVLFAAQMMACGNQEVGESATHQMRVVESYGETLQRSVAINASWYAPDADSLEFAEVTLTLTPGEQPMVQKLETLLEETGFKWRAGGNTWPQLARSAPPDALPMLTRLQLATLLLYGAEDFTIDHPFVNLSNAPASLGTTRVERRGNALSLSTIALVMDGEGGHLAWAKSSGQFDQSGVTLEGTRRFDNGQPERVKMTISRIKTD
mgnify:CR=1 FL=1